MSSRAKVSKRIMKFFQKKEKKGLSIVIGYVLLIVVSIVMSVLVFMWLRSYVPGDLPACPEGASLFIKDISYDCTKSILNVTVKNNGKFSLDGYFIRVSNRSADQTATIDISHNITSGGNWSGSAITFNIFHVNAFSPEENKNVKTSTFNVTGYGTLYRIEIIPTRVENVSNVKRFISCGDAKVEQTLTCS